MTQNMASGHSFTARSKRSVALQGIEHGYVAKPSRKKRFVLWKWIPRAVLGRGAIATRDDERAYRDIQAVRDHDEWESVEHARRF
jgi:hypothetical protein